MPENDRELKEYSLKEREYRGDDGQIHHHTHAYMRRQEEEGTRERSGESGGGGREGGSRSGGGQSASKSRGAESGSGRESQSRGGSRSGGESKSRGGSRSRSESESQGRGQSGSRNEGRARGGREEEEEGSAREAGYTALVTAVAVGVTAITAAALMAMFRARNEELVVHDIPRRDTGYADDVGERDGRDGQDRGGRY